MKFTLTHPCAKCPFRTDVPGFLGPGRAEKIADALLSDCSFECHATLDYSECEEVEDEPARTEKTQHCAGALILLEKLEQPNQLMRWIERLGGYDRCKLDMSAPVFDDEQDFIEHHEAQW